jgi:hypothetical protein
MLEIETQAHVEIMDDNAGLPTDIRALPYSTCGYFESKHLDFAWNKPCGEGMADDREREMPIYSCSGRMLSEPGIDLGVTLLFSVKGLSPIDERKTDVYGFHGNVRLTPRIKLPGEAGRCKDDASYNAYNQLHGNITAQNGKNCKQNITERI